MNDWRRHQQWHQCIRCTVRAQTRHIPSRWKKCHDSWMPLFHEKWRVCKHASLDRSTLYWAIFPFNDLRPLTRRRIRGHHSHGSLRPHYWTASLPQYTRRIAHKLFLFAFNRERQRRWHRSSEKYTPRCTLSTRRNKFYCEHKQVVAHSQEIVSIVSSRTLNPEMNRFAANQSIKRESGIFEFQPRKKRANAKFNKSPFYRRRIAAMPKSFSN